MNEYEKQIPGLVIEALQNGATIPMLESILGPKAEKYLYESGIVSRGDLGGLGGRPMEPLLDPEAQAVLTDLNPITPNKGIFAQNEGIQQNLDFTKNNSQNPNGPSLLEIIMASSQGGGADRAYGQAKDMQQFAGLGKLLSMSNQMMRNDRSHRRPGSAAPGPSLKNMHLRSLLGG